MGFLRTFLAITVVFAHSPWNGGLMFVGGQNAVQLFYIVSGFLIAHVIRTNPVYGDPFKFYLNRALRLYPIYLVVAVITLGARVLTSPKFFEFYHDIPTAAATMLVFSNLFLFGQDWLMFAGVSNNEVVFATDYRQSDCHLYTGLLVPQAWTLGVELSFYAMAPFILRNRTLLLSLLAASLAIRCALIAWGPGANDPWTYRFFPAELSLFLFGALANQFLLPFWKKFLASTKHDALPAWATVLLIASFASYFLIPVDENIKRIAMYAIFLTLLPLAFLYQKASRLDKAIGELGYPIYIGHMLVTMSFGAWAVKHGISDPLVTTLGNVVFSVGFAYVLNWFVGSPMERIRENIKSTRKGQIRSASTIRARRTASSSVR
ncbi:acyltransferase family protein [Massilia horti]|uniref:Acyltransferase n=1 Tax=Massilia horti TaxID=2562153 RepID=A0A4Y9T2D6_9BURK|nr:acyltransferase [Massilia horti]TFW33246.1 acyltransferase [Massilia horti]